MKISELPLNDLYARPKITASVEAAICSKETFSDIVPTYCEKVCKLKCKQQTGVRLLNIPVDILIIQDHEAMNGKWDRREGQQEQVQRNIIDFIARQAGFAGLTYRVVNLLKCKPNEQDFIRGKPPTATTLLKCKPYLHAEIAASKPKVIISLATVVTKALGLKHCSNTGDRGRIVETEFGPVVITLHPRALTMIRQNASGALWGSDYMNIILGDFIKAERIIRSGLNIPDLMSAIEFYRQNRIRVAKSIDDVRQFVSEINSLPANSIISFDTETTSLDPMADNAKLLCVQFGWRDPVTKEIIAAVIPLWHRENTAYDGDEAWELVRPILEGNIGKVAHNGKFDILYIWHTTGVRVRNLKFDTMLVLHSISSGNQGCYGLKTAVSDHLYESGLSGYEDLLPKLTKGAAAEETESEESESD